MALFFGSLVTGFIGLVMGLYLLKNEYCLVFAVVGFFLPYAIVIGKIYDMLKLQQHRMRDTDNEEPVQGKEES